MSTSWSLKFNGYCAQFVPHLGTYTPYCAAPLVQCAHLCGIGAELREGQTEAPLEISGMDQCLEMV